MAAGRGIRIIRGAATWIACILTVAAIGVLLLACWAPALLGAPPDDERPRWHFGFHRRQPPAQVHHD